jgi:diadenosine tetraphosphate (Ap4A) HIT family hydrolase
MLQKKKIVAIYSLIQELKKKFDSELKPDAYNVGINAVVEAGQTVMHLHVHLIPRYKGDMENPKGGIRKLKKALVEYDG